MLNINFIIIRKSQIVQLFLFLTLCLFMTQKVTLQIQNADVLNAPIDISKDFKNYLNTFYFADELTSFDPQIGKGTVKYLRYNYQTRQAFNNIEMKPTEVVANEFPTTEYEASPVLPFQIQFVSDRTLRIKMTSGPQFHPEKESLMLVDGVQTITVSKKGNSFEVESNQLNGKTTFKTEWIK